MFVVIVAFLNDLHFKEQVPSMFTLLLVIIHIAKCYLIWTHTILYLWIFIFQLLLESTIHTHSCNYSHWLLSMWKSPD